MRTVKVPIEGHSYEIHVGSGLLENSGALLREACGGGTRAVVISDSHVAPLYGAKVRATLERAGVRVAEVAVPAGESSKSLSEVARVCDAMIDAGLDRSSFLVALGGGVVGDLAGFVAAIYYRGIPYAQVPTTVLAQVDSSVGGKTGVNAPGGKNLIGAFHHPAVVVADVDTLSTLPPREFHEGMAEVIKHGIIRDAALVHEALKLAREDRETLIARNVAIKANIVVQDQFETLGLRALLNFGHTVGHAIEQAAGYGRFLHGEAISMGMAAALHLSQKFAGLSKTEADSARTALTEFGLPVTIPADLSTESLLASMARDKKFKEGQIRFVLAPTLGSAVLSSEVDGKAIEEAISSCRG
jgi:3-dehydroquinate synthase